MAKTVYQGGASIDENGNAYGGAAGNQTGSELRARAWYKHKLGWVVIRARDPAVRKKLAEAMRRAVANRKIGYDQWARNTLWNAVRLVGYDPARAMSPVETDCSALVRVCCAYAGIVIDTAFRTTTEPEVLRKTGAFDLLTDARYTDYPDRLREGDILCTKTQGHTVIVLNDGDLAYEDDADSFGNPYPEPTILLRKGIVHTGVKWCQWHLNRLGYDLGKWGVDGDFGALTDKAVRAFQAAQKIEVDGVAGKITRGRLKL